MPNIPDSKAALAQRRLIGQLRRNDFEGVAALAAVLDTCTAARPCRSAACPVCGSVKPPHQRRGNPMATLSLAHEVRARIDAQSAAKRNQSSRVETSDDRAPSPSGRVDQPWDRAGGDFALESERQARAEDAIRARRLEWVRPLDRPMCWTTIGPKLRLAKQALPHVRPPTPDPEALDALAAKLAEGLAGRPSNSLGSAAAMRVIRQTVFRAMLDAFGDYPDAELATVTVVNSGWTLSPGKLATTSAAKIKARYRSDLNKLGITRMPGPFIAFLHGEFEPSTGLFVLHFHCLTTQAKAEALKGLKPRKGSKAFLGYRPTASGAAPVVVRPVRDRWRQFTYLLKAFWPARAIRWIDGVQKRDRRGHRIPEPFGTQVLLWLDRQRLRDLTIMNDCWSMRKGGTAAMKRLYLSVFGAW